MVPFCDVTRAVERRFNIVVDLGRAPVGAQKTRRQSGTAGGCSSGCWCIPAPAACLDPQTRGTRPMTPHTGLTAIPRRRTHRGGSESRRLVLGFCAGGNRCGRMMFVIPGESVVGLPDRATACLTGIEGMSMCSHLCRFHPPAAWCPELPTARRTSEPAGEHGREKEPERRWPG